MEKKLAPHLVWLFALGAVGAGLGVSYATLSSGGWVAAIAFAVVFGGIACAAAWLTRSTTFQAVTPFVVASVGLAVIYFIIVKRAVTDAVGSSSIADAGGTMLAVYAAAKGLIAALGASIGGAIFGIKLRSVRSLGDLVKRPG
jgi:hypothetical protein